MSAAHPSNVDVLLGVPVEVSAELGRCSMRVREVLQVGPGSLVMLERAAGAPVDVRVNGELIARGEIIALDERYGIRIVELLGPGSAVPPE
jgi:flagellar motor switch protein FliN/FliY